MGTSHSRVSRTGSSSSGDTIQRSIMYIEADELAYFSDEDVNNLQKSINEMAACREIFDSWAAELADNPPRKRRELHQNIKSQISSLQDDTESALLASDNIVKALQSFSSLMVRRLREAKGNDGVVKSVPQIEQTATGIQTYSEELSRHVERMCEKLGALVCTLEELKVREKKSLRERIWGWLEIIFSVLSSLLAIAALPIPALGVASMIASSASSISSQMGNRARSDEDYDKIFGFLKDRIPQEAKKIQAHFQNFNACQNAIRKELEIAKQIDSGIQVKLRPAEALQAENVWDQQSATWQLIRRPSRF